METIATLQRISRERLATILLASTSASTPTPTSTPRIAIIDVRDSDHLGGHIRGSRHVPSGSLDHMAADLVRQLRGADVVVFHCMLSQQRGPSAALRYLRERSRLLGDEAGKSTGGEVEQGEGGAGSAQVKSKGQEVYVLDGGFQKWQEKYGNNEQLTEAYQKDLWEFGY